MSNPFDQASRYLAKLDPQGFLGWLFADRLATLRFLRWADTRTLPFPGEPERTCDTVADLADTLTGQRYALPLEFLAEPDPGIFGRLLEYAARVWREIRPVDLPQRRFLVVPAVLHLTGSVQIAREMRLGDSPWHLRLDPLEKNLTDEDAAQTLAAMATGRLRLVLLPLVPLMRGGSEPGIIDQWKQLAQTEQDTRRRSDYAGLALVLAELTNAPHLWRQALEGWNMRQSMQVLEWQAEARQEGKAEGRLEGKIEGKIEDLLRLLEKRFRRKVPAVVVQRIRATTDIAQLAEWFDKAITIGSMKEFRELLK
jgi:hypothetical protein